ncbi:hypothetical protein FMM05_07420 [Flavobacterium zepuense]|uniref:Copper-binding protein MbnP-like domain-containing protein n=1 Tax=Flavobacterium zepuense TaxID=2593302 RepID=A0A552V3U6_9FLAO|nr:MbnP family protein [Flavobacterium zepuense]TRW25131.1 hypothetical protein FMM05_07420 [Flavobacterium zepuense]
MKFKLQHIVAVMAMAASLVSCNDDDDSSQNLEGTFGDAELFFENGFAGNEFNLGAPYINGNGETITINRLNYIISNVVFIKADGTEYTYPKADSYFIVSEEAGSFTVHLEQLPAGDYTKVRFGVGVDTAQYQLGLEAQQDFWSLAITNNMASVWANGYRFVNTEGTFTSATVPLAKAFSMYQQNTNGNDNYNEITFNLPNTARVRHDIAPSIHFKTDVSLFLDGANKIVLANNLTADGSAAVIDGGDNLVKIAGNTDAVFSVDHVHNESGTEHAD